jgi:hypothetical protein
MIASDHGRAAPADADREDGEDQARDELADLNSGLFDADPADSLGGGDAFEQDPVGHSVGEGLGDAGQAGGDEEHPEPVGHGHQKQGERREDEDERHEREVGMPVGEPAQGGAADGRGAEAGGGKEPEVSLGDADFGNDRVARGTESVEQDRSGGHRAEEDAEQSDARGPLVVAGHRSPPVARMLQVSMLAGGGRRLLRCLSCRVSALRRARLRGSALGQVRVRYEVEDLRLSALAEAEQTERVTGPVEAVSGQGKDEPGARGSRQCLSGSHGIGHSVERRIDICLVVVEVESEAHIVSGLRIPHPGSLGAAGAGADETVGAGGSGADGEESALMSMPANPAPELRRRLGEVRPRAPGTSTH